MFSRSAAMHSHGNSTQVFETECAALVLLKLDENRTLRYSLRSKHPLGFCVPAWGRSAFCSSFFLLFFSLMRLTSIMSLGCSGLESSLSTWYTRRRTTSWCPLARSKTWSGPSQRTPRSSGLGGGASPSRCRGCSMGCSSLLPAKIAVWIFLRRSSWSTRTTATYFVRERKVNNSQLMLLAIHWTIHILYVKFTI